MSYPSYFRAASRMLPACLLPLFLLASPTSAADAALAAECGVLEEDMIGGAVCRIAAAADAVDDSLQLRQLRVRREAVADLEQPVVTSDGAPVDGQSSEGQEDDMSEGVPGGWGEAATYVDTERDDKAAYLKNMLATAGLSTAASWSSCAQAGCSNYYIKWRSCQCNPACGRFRNCCYDYAARCAPPPTTTAIWDANQMHQHQTKTLYHNTGYDAGMAILRDGFRPGTSGWCGGGIYFAETPQATLTKAIGPQSHQGFMIEAQVDVGLVAYGDQHCTSGGRTMSNTWMRQMGYDSVSFNPGDGNEYIVFSNAQIISTRQVPFP